MVIQIKQRKPSENGRISWFILPFTGKQGSKTYWGTSSLLYKIIINKFLPKLLQVLAVYNS